MIILLGLPTAKFFALDEYFYAILLNPSLRIFNLPEQPSQPKMPAKILSPGFPQQLPGLSLKLFKTLELQQISGDP